MLGQRVEAFLRDPLALAFERERLGHHRHRQDAEFPGHFRHHRRRAGAGAAAHAGGEEQHVAPLISSAMRSRSSSAAWRPISGFGARAQALGDARAELQLHFGLVALQRLRIGVGADELHALHALRDHVVDRVAAAAADADHLDYRFLRLRYR